jgi:catalase
MTDLEASPALSIVRNGPSSFAGRKIGALITDGTDATLLEALREAATDEGALVELIAPKIGGAVLSDGTLMPAHQKIDGGPSVLYDAVAVLASSEGAALLAQQKPAVDFVNDAHAHCKFIAHTAESQALLAAAGVADYLDDGYVAIGGRGDVAGFVARCRAVRFWARTPGIEVSEPVG